MKTTGSAQLCNYLFHWAAVAYLFKDHLYCNTCAYTLQHYEPSKFEFTFHLVVARRAICTSPMCCLFLVCFPSGCRNWWSKRPGYLEITQLTSSHHWSSNPWCSGGGWTRRSWLSGHTPGHRHTDAMGFPYPCDGRNKESWRTSVIWTQLISLPH
jgi:hypothetical protein